ncbi:MAG: tetratricopeptide repeat protein [Longimicrobiales bacterium]
MVHLTRRARPISLCIGLLTVLVAGANPALAQSAHLHDAAALGSVRFEVSCETVADDFDRALALLHHMQYQESRAAFEAIAAADDKCAMAHWGIAVTLFQPLWPARPGPDALKRGWSEVQKAIALGVDSPREAGLLHAASEFFRDPESAEWWTRIGRWSEAMTATYETHSDDQETAAFYALSQLAAGQIADDRMAYQSRAAQVLLEIYDEEPRHPGAIHYTIHANDVTTRASESLEVVRSYDDIAPEVPHALHMPTHIFVRLGEWPEVIRWNRKSADAALRFPAGDRLSHHYPHALDYLVYANLQRGDDRAATDVLGELSRQTEPFQGTFISAFHLAAIEARYAVERRAWTEAKTVRARSHNYLDWDKFWWAESLSWFARGLGAAHTGDVDEAERAEAEMLRLRNDANAAGEEGFGTYIEIDRLVLSAWRSYAAGDWERAQTALTDAVALEATTQKHPVTPGAIYPPQEALGDLLFKLNRPLEALEAYEASLATWPERFNSMIGAARSARAADREDTARAHYEKLLKSTSDESQRSEIAEARSFLLS